MPIRLRDQFSLRARMAAMAGDDTAAFVGQNVAASPRIGTIAAQSGFDTSVIVGVFTSAPHRTGVIATTAAADIANYRGTFVSPAPPGRVGTIAKVAGADTSAIAGTFVPAGPVWQAGTITQSLTVGVPFTLNLDSLCTGALSYSIAAGTLPAGLAMSGAKNAIISGTPTASGSLNVTFQASDSSAFTTAFPLTESPMSQGGIWQRGQSEGIDWLDPKTTPGRCTAIIQSGTPAPNHYNDTIAHLKTSFQTFTANQYAKGVVYRAPGYTPPQKHEVELHVRQTIGPHSAVGYEVGWGMDGSANQAYLFVTRWDGGLGSFTTIFDPGNGSMPMPNDGDELYIQIVGNIITAKLNNVTVPGFSAINVGSVISSGQPGIGFWPVDGATPANFGWKSYEAGNLP